MKKRNVKINQTNNLYNLDLNYYNNIFRSKHGLFVAPESLQSDYTQDEIDNGTFDIDVYDRWANDISRIIDKILNNNKVFLNKCVINDIEQEGIACETEIIQTSLKEAVCYEIQEWLWNGYDDSRDDASLSGAYNTSQKERQRITSFDLLRSEEAKTLVVKIAQRKTIIARTTVSQLAGEINPVNTSVFFEGQLGEGVLDPDFFVPNLKWNSKQNVSVTVIDLSSTTVEGSLNELSTIKADSSELTDLDNRLSIIENDFSVFSFTQEGVVILKVPFVGGQVFIRTEKSQYLQSAHLTEVENTQLIVDGAQNGRLNELESITNSIVSLPQEIFNGNVNGVLDDSNTEFDIVEFVWPLVILPEDFKSYFITLDVNGVLITDVLFQKNIWNTQSDGTLQIDTILIDNNIIIKSDELTDSPYSITIIKSKQNVGVLTTENITGIINNIPKTTIETFLPVYDTTGSDEAIDIDTTRSASQGFVNNTIDTLEDDISNNLKEWKTLWTGTEFLTGTNTGDLTYNGDFGSFPNNNSKGEYEFKIIFSAVSGDTTSTGSSSTLYLSSFTKTNGSSIGSFLNISGSASHMEATGKYLLLMLEFVFENNAFNLQAIVEAIKVGTPQLRMREVWIREKQEGEK